MAKQHETDGQPPVETTFISEHAALAVFANGVRIAQFVGGQFVTADAAVLAVLRDVAACREVGGDDD